eukprot:EG_transcript_902
MVAALYWPNLKGLGDHRVDAFLGNRAIGLSPSRGRLFNGILGQRGLPHCRALSGHSGCVNSIAFSRPDGRLLVSGSDDRRVLLWRCFDRQAGSQPLRAYAGHSSNVFCTALADGNRFIVSCGNDGKILRYDVEQTPAPIAEYLHEDSVHKVSIHAEDPNVFISASHDFTLKLWDVRAGVAPQGTIVGLDAFNAVACSPSDSQLFLSCDGSAICLWDLRKSFGPDQGPSLEAARQCKQRVLRQYMAVCRHHSGLIFLPEISGVEFNRLGTHFVCSAWKAVPLLYSVESPAPLMAFHAEEYSNKVTQKSASFAGSNDEFVICGSDDWGVYMWNTGSAKRQADDSHYRLPSSRSKCRLKPQKFRIHQRSQPKSLRRVQTNAEWVVEAPVHVLRGHQSIVNSVDWNVAEPMVASAGVESRIRLWSPWPLPGAGEGGTEPVRAPRREFSVSRVTALRELVGRDAVELDEMSSEANTLELFDYYTVRMESGSEGDSASHSELGRCGGGGADDSSEVDWEAWETQSDSAPEPAREDEAPFERLFSSDSDCDVRGYDSLGSGSDSPLRLPHQRSRPHLSMMYDSAALVQQLSEPLLTIPVQLPPAAQRICHRQELRDQRRSLSEQNEGCNAESSTDVFQSGIHALGTTRSSPNSVLQCLGRIASNSTDYPISDTTPTRREDQVSEGSPPLDEPIGQRLSSGTSVANHAPEVPESEVDSNGDFNSGSEEDLHARKRPRSTAGSPDSASRPSKRCE